jgi:hypothetical protein
VTLNTNGSFTYIPTTDYVGDDTFTYQAYDGALYSNTATVTIHVNDDTPPVLPSSFYGSINITPAPIAGDLVEAYVPGAASPVATATITAGTPLTYAIDVPADITFKINGWVVGTGTWHTGTHVQLNFTATTHSIALVSGWNLVSFNLRPADTAIATVLSSINDNYELVYAWNATTQLWMKYDPNVPYGATLTSMDETMGFWIKMTTGDTLDVSGSAPSTSNIALKTGWNLVGYPSQTNLVLPDVFSLHGVGTDFSLVYAYHANETDVWKKYDRTAPFGNDLTELVPGWGYWVKVGGDHTWDVSY